MTTTPRPAVLVVEDDEVLLDLYRLILTDAGLDVITADNGQTGLAAAELHRPDLVLLDLMMPVMGGLDMLAKLRSSDWGKQMRVMIMTNVGRSETPSSIARLGVEDTLVKVSLGPDELVRKVKLVLAA